MRPKFFSRAGVPPAFWTISRLATAMLGLTTFLPAQTFLNYDRSGNLAAGTAPSTSPPVLLAALKDRVVAPGELASFSPVLANPAGCTYQWRFHGTNLPGRTQETLLLLNVSNINQGPYSVVITNISGSVTSSVAQLYIDTDRDGLPDSWEQTYFAGIGAPRGAVDSDGDGISNLDEFYEGTNPNDRNSFRSRLNITATGGSVVVVPYQPSYELTNILSLTGIPFAPNSFEGWLGDLTGITNPASLLMSTNRFVRGLFDCFAPQWGLAAWWRGEKSAEDFISTNHGSFYSAGTTVPGTFTTSALVGSALAFYGTNHIRIADNTALRPSQLTLEAWVFPTVQNGTYQTIVARGAIGNDDNSYYLGILNGVPHFWSKHATLMLALSGGTTPLNQWTHVVATFDGSTKRLYVNGLQVAVQSGLAGLSYDGGSIPVTIGADWVNNGPGYLFNGFLDEVSVFHRALSASEIIVLFNDNAAGKCRNRPVLTTAPALADALQGATYTQQIGSVLGTMPVSYSLSAGMLPSGLSLSPAGVISGIPTQPGSNVFGILVGDAAGISSEMVCGMRVLPVPAPAMPHGLIGWWRAENNALDSIGTNHGILKNGAGFGPGVAGSGLALDGVDDAMEIPDSPTLRPSSLTAECWVMFTNITGVQVIFSKPAGSGFLNSMVFWWNNGDLRATFGTPSAGGEVLIAPFAPVTGRWYHVAYTFDELTRFHRLFLDGQQVAAGGVGLSIVYDSNPWLLGREAEFGSGNYYVKGRIDEASLYNRALAATEVQAIFAAASAGKQPNGPYINTGPQLADALVATPYAQTITAVSGTPSVSFAITSGSLPAGLTLSPAGLISGTPLDAGTNTFTVRVTDSLNAFSERQFTLATYAPAPPPAGIVGWWRAEANSLDSIGTNHGTLQNGAGFAPGKTGQSFAFNGVNQALAIPDSPGLRSTSFTIEAWVQLLSVGGTQVIFAKPVGTGPHNSYAVYLENGSLRALVGDTSGFSPPLSGTWNPVAGIWYHIAYSFDNASLSQVLYLNGTPLVSGTANRSPQFDNNALFIGRDMENASPAFHMNGRLDEAAVYDRPLTGQEIAALWNAGSAGKAPTGPYISTPPVLPEGMVGAGYTQNLAAARGTAPLSYSVLSGSLPPGLTLSPAGLLTGRASSSGNYQFLVRVTDALSRSSTRDFSLTIVPNAPPPPGIVAWWRAEGNPLDAIGSSHATLINQTAYAPGRVGQGFLLDGVNDAVRVPDTAALRPASLTFEGWFWFSNSGGTRTLAAKPLGSGTLNSFILNLHNNNLAANIADLSGFSTEVSTPFAPVAGQWYHLAFTFDDGNKQMTLYINGARAGFNLANRSIAYDSSALQFGRDLENGSAVTHFGGRIDEPTLYNRALNAEEIARIFAASSLGKLQSGPYLTTPPALPEAVLNQPYNLAFGTARTTGPATILIAGGALPPGLSLSSDGVLAGTPTVPGQYSFSLRLSDASGISADGAYTLTVTAPVPPPAGIISWWRAENDGQDAIGPNHGQLLNSLTFAQGKAGNAFVMDGTDTTVEIPDHPSLRPASFTVESWVLFNSTTSIRHIFAKPIGSSTLDSIGVWYEPGNLRAGVSDTIAFGTTLSWPFTPALGRWYHIAYRYDQESMEQALYVDGMEVAAGFASRIVAYDANPFLLGSDLDSTAPSWFLNGRMDEAAIYNRALNADEIFGIYRAGASGKSTTGLYFVTGPNLPVGLVNAAYSRSLSVTRASLPVTFAVVGGALPPGFSLTPAGLLSGTPATTGTYTWTVRATDNLGAQADQTLFLQVYAATPAPAGLFAWWRAEGNGMDSAGTNHGTPAGAVTFLPGKAGTAFSFDGITANVQVTNASALFNGLSQFSVETWIKANPQQPEASFLIVDKSHGFADGTGWGLQGNPNGTVSFFFGKGGSSAPSSFVGTNTLTSVLDNRWHHLVGVYDGAAIYIYMDGFLHGMLPVADKPVGNSRNVSIGQSWGAGFPGRRFRGLIDEVSFYTNALSSPDVMALYNAGPGGKALQSTPFPPIVILASLSDSNLEISFAAAPGRTYSLQYSPDLATSNWSVITNRTAVSDTLVLAIPATNTQGFYRVFTLP